MRSDKQTSLAALHYFSFLLLGHCSFLIIALSWSLLNLCYCIVQHSSEWNIEIKLYCITFKQGIFFTVHSLNEINRRIISIIVLKNVLLSVLGRGSSLRRRAIFYRKSLVFSLFCSLFTILHCSALTKARQGSPIDNRPGLVELRTRTTNNNERM